MQPQDETQQAAELRQAFLRHLPKRLEMMRKRGLRLSIRGWDINALTNLYHDVQVLAGACGRYGLLDIGEQLFSIENFLAPFANDVTIPNPTQSALLVERLHRLEPLIDEHTRQYGEKQRDNAALTLTLANERNGYPLQVTPPPDYWKRFEKTVAAPIAAAASAAPTPTPTATSVAKPTSQPTTPAPIAVTPAPTKAPEQPAEAIAVPRRAETPKVYHLSDGNPLACEVDQKLEAAGYELTILDNAGELREMLASFPPHMVIVDAPFQDAIEAIGELIKAVRPKLSHRLALLAFSASPELPVRLRAMRAGADAFVTTPAKSDDVVARIAELLAADSADPFRVLIVEDDRSQAIFAESILRKAGMSTCMATEPLVALEQLDTFKPELILMDLYMPNCDGMELTSIIREREAFISTPIVFLSGEQDEDKHFAALNSGGDDFLSKPIRPKHLISAVTNRVQRARQLSRRARAANQRDPVTGLYERAHVIDRINAALARENSDLGGVMYVEIDAAKQIRERVGLLIFDTLLNQVGAFLAGHVGSRDLVTRYSDTSFLLVTHDGQEESLRQFATKLRDLVAHAAFEHEGKTFAVGLSIGICPFAAELGDVGAMLNAAERAMVDAQKTDPAHVGLFRSGQARKRDANEAFAEAIRTAIKTDGFQLLFQPIVALKGEDGEQFQALLRLRGDNGKLYTAAEIVPFAERENLIDEVDRWVVSRCMMVLAERERQKRPVRLFVSQAIEAAGDPQRIGWIRQMLETRRISGERLVLEFRLNDALAHLRDLTDFSAAARKLGIGISLSGFEGGAAAYQLLDRVSVNFLKIAPRYVEEGASDPARRLDLQQLVAYCHERGHDVIAPRIEDARAAAWLWTAGIDYIQGDFVQKAAQDLNYDFQASTN